MASHSNEADHSIPPASPLSLVSRHPVRSLWISAPSPNIYVDLAVLFMNGRIVGSLLNHSLAHVLDLTPPATHVIVIPLNAMFRNFSGSFGSSGCSGLFLRILQKAVTQGFLARGLFEGKEELTRLLVGTTILVRKLTDVDKY